MQVHHFFSLKKLIFHLQLFPGAFELITDESKAGSCLWITNRRGMEYWPNAMEETKYLVLSSSSRRRTINKEKLNLQLPQNFEKM